MLFGADPDSSPVATVEVFVAEFDCEGGSRLEARLDEARMTLGEGCAVRVVVPTDGPSRVDFERGLWVHRIAGGFAGYAAAASAELDRIRSFIPQMPVGIRDLSDSL